MLSRPVFPVDAEADALEWDRARLVEDSSSDESADGRDFARPAERAEALDLARGRLELDAAADLSVR